NRVERLSCSRLSRATVAQSLASRFPMTLPVSRISPGNDPIRARRKRFDQAGEPTLPTLHLDTGTDREKNSPTGVHSARRIPRETVAALQARKTAAQTNRLRFEHGLQRRWCRGRPSELRLGQAS